LHLNNEGDRFPILKYDNLVLENNKIKFKLAFEYDEYYHAFKDFTRNHKVVWPGGGDKIPLAIPECGWDGKCSMYK
jgi:hypothetical protein